MNKFDIAFFNKYVPKGQEIKKVIHTHPISIIIPLIIKISLFVIIPSIFYLNSIRIQEIIPFIFFEIYLIIMYIKFIYDIFNWYNDVWLITDSGVILLKRSFLKSNSDSINYENIEGVGVEAVGIMDKVFSKGDLMIHKIGDDSFVLYSAANPYKSVDLIEKLSEEKTSGSKDAKFDIIMDALSGVVGEYLQETKIIQKEHDKIDDKIQKIKRQNSTIDLSQD